VGIDGEGGAPGLEALDGEGGGCGCAAGCVGCCHVVVAAARRREGDGDVGDCGATEGGSVGGNLGFSGAAVAGVRRPARGRGRLAWALLLLVRSRWCCRCCRGWASEGEWSLEVARPAGKQGENGRGAWLWREQHMERGCCCFWWRMALPRLCGWGMED